MEQPELPFDGKTYDPKRDGERLGAQLLRVLTVMSDGQWHTPRDLERRIGAPWASISARLRDFRKEKFGSYTVDREYVYDGLWKYRLRRP